MSKSNQQILWTEELLFYYKVIADGNDLKTLCQEYIDKNISDSLKISYNYSLKKTLGGIPIEIGEVIIFPMDLEKILNLLSDFVIIPKKNNLPPLSDLTILQDVNKLQQWAKELQWEILDPSCCEGYIYNYELVNFYKNEYNVMVLQFKYKTSVNSPFILYKLSFIKEKGCFIFQQNSF